MRYNDIIPDSAIDKMIEAQRDYEYCGPYNSYQEYLRGPHRAPVDYDEENEEGQNENCQDY